MSQFKQPFITPEMSDKILLLPSLVEVTLGQTIIASYCAKMMEFARTGKAAEIYFYYHRLAELISDDNTVMLIAPLLFKAEGLLAEHYSMYERATERIRSFQ